MAMRTELAEVFDHLRREPEEAVDPVAAMRAMVEGYGMGCAGAGLSACRVVPVRIGAVMAEWLVPPDAGDGRIVYCHGGGWVAGSLTSHRTLAAELAYLSGFAVLVPDYRLAPEHPFPAAPIDCEAATRWVASSPAELGRTASGIITMPNMIISRNPSPETKGCSRVRRVAKVMPPAARRVARCALASRAELHDGEPDDEDKQHDRLRGGLAQVNVVQSIIFAGMSGSAIADAAGTGSMMQKLMTSRHCQVRILKV